MSLRIQDNAPDYDSAKGELRFGNLALFKFEIVVFGNKFKIINDTGVDTDVLKKMIMDLGWMS